jgi:glutathione S-transferase
MILYQFPNSPFARRVRVALALKGLSAELRDTRNDATHREASHRLNPMKTVPVLVDGDRVITQSAAMIHYLDEKHPTPPLWPTGPARAVTAEWISQIDSVITIVVDLTMRYTNLRDSAEFPAARREMVDRAQRTLDALAAIAQSKDWYAGEQAMYTFIAWWETLPGRTATFPPAQRMLDLGLVIPPALTRWADQHRQRPEVAT